jgi:hypothetical protein
MIIDTKVCQYDYVVGIACDDSLRKEGGFDSSASAFAASFGIATEQVCPLASRNAIRHTITITIFQWMSRRVNYNWALTRVLLRSIAITMCFILMTYLY